MAGAVEPRPGLQPAPFFFTLPHRKDGSEPGPRCGHTLTAISLEGGASRLLLFGGATALEAGSSQSTPGGTGIRAWRGSGRNSHPLKKDGAPLLHV